MKLQETVMTTHLTIFLEKGGVFSKQNLGKRTENEIIERIPFTG